MVTIFNTFQSNSEIMGLHPEIVIVKIILSRISLAYSISQKIGLFKHGDMENTKCSLEFYQKHFDNVNLKKNFASLELGPRDSANTVLFNKAFVFQNMFGKVNL